MSYLVCVVVLTFVTLHSPYCLPFVAKKVTCAPCIRSFQALTCLFDFDTSPLVSVVIVVIICRLPREVNTFVRLGALGPVCCWF